MKKNIRQERGVAVIPFFLLFVLLTASGCVSTSKYDALEEQFNSSQQEKATLEKSNEDLSESLKKEQKDNYQLKSSNKDYKNEIAELEKQTQELERQKRQQKEEMDSMVVALEEKVNTNEAKIVVMEGALKMDLLERLFFKKGSAEVSKAGRDLLRRIAPVLKNAVDQEILVIGHADPLPPSDRISDKYPSNWELSAARATEVVRILQWGYGISPDRLVAQGVAHYRPLQLGNGKDPVQKERAVEIHLKARNK
ncbi:MAG: OmpA family protein [Proteobacteria bacterium]|nr:OmpA family protein [Pseudomonadota bacterium]MBU1709256.1 OmpA family protein [Pseudomonadota bacterium]